MNRPEPRSRETFFFVDLPVPPSANALNKNAPGKGRVLLVDYSQWQRDAGYLVNAAVRGGLPSGPWGVTLSANIRHHRDIDNLVKPTNDLLVKCGIIDDDRYIEEGDYKRLPEGHNIVPEGYMRISVYSLLGRWPEIPTEGDRAGTRAGTRYDITGGGLEGEVVTVPVEPPMVLSDGGEFVPLKGEV